MYMYNRMKRIGLRYYSLCAQTGLALAFCGFLCQAASSQPAEDLRTRPDPAGTPTKVEIAIVMLDIDEIDDAEQTFTANVFVHAQWQDPRLANPSAATRTIKLSELWHPDIQILNQHKLFKTFPDELDVAPDGTVVFQQRYWGEFSQPLRLQGFPFDAHSFQVISGVVDKTGDVQLVASDDPIRPGLGKNLTIPDWKIESWEVLARPVQAVLGGPTRSGYVFTFTAKRYLGYYIYRLIIPLTLIVMMSWFVFWIDPTQSSTQFSVAITSMLTLIAYRFAVGHDLPRISYLTRMDTFLLGCTVLVFLALAETLLTARLAGAGKEEVALKFDRWSRVLFPVSFVILIIYSIFG